jgi:hypothetical protein
VTNKSGLGWIKRVHYPRVLNETRRLTAITRVAATVLFKALAIFVAVIVGNSIRLASGVELGDALG